MWEIISAFGSIAAIYIGFHAIQWLAEFCSDPEQALERLGGLVAAFRRGLEGKVSGRTDGGPVKQKTLS